jgi:hypothetical protein
MPYNGQVIFDGKRGVELAQEHLRHALADEILARLLREDRDRAFLDVRDLPRAGLDELLGEFWLAYGWRERRRLARAVDWRLAIVREVLQSVGHGLPSVGPGLLEVDMGACAVAKEALAAHRRARAAARERAAWRRDNLMPLPT